MQDGTHVSHIFVINANGSGQPVRLTSSSSTDLEPAWSGDALKIVFTRVVGNAAQLYIMNADGTNQRPVPGAFGHNPTWSIDQTRLAYQCTINYHTQICAINADGSHYAVLTNTSLGNSFPAWQIGPPVAHVKVLDEQQTPVPDAEVYRNDAPLGTTDSDGLVDLPNPAAGDQIVARTLIYTGTTQKGNHDGWDYHVYLTNIDQNNDGSQSNFAITDPTLPEQDVTIKKSDAQIGFNMVASFGYDASEANLADFADAFPSASAYLFDVSDGQMFFENLTLFDDHENYTDADIQLPAGVSA